MTDFNDEFRDKFDKANRALFEGNRGEIAKTLEGLPPSGRKLWLLAAAADDENERAKLLQKVVMAGEQPYADMARGILEREEQFAKEMKRVPKWQAWIQRHHRTIIFLSTVVCAVALGLLILGPRLFPPPAPQVAEGPGAEGTPGAQPTPTPRPTATVTPFPPELRSQVEYLPIGSLQVLNVEFPTERAVSGGSGPAEPPRGAVFIAIQYEFTCGSARAFCENPPEAALKLQLADTRIAPIPDSGYTLSGSPPIGSVASGISGTAWVVFPVPENQSPTQLILELDMDGDGQVDSTRSAPLQRN